MLKYMEIKATKLFLFKSISCSNLGEYRATSNFTIQHPERPLLGCLKSLHSYLIMRRFQIQSDFSCWRWIFVVAATNIEVCLAFSHLNAVMQKHNVITTPVQTFLYIKINCQCLCTCTPTSIHVEKPIKSVLLMNAPVMQNYVYPQRNWHQGVLWQHSKQDK